MAGENIGKYNILLEFLTSTNGVDKVKKETTGLENVFGRAKAAFAGIVAGQSLISAGKAIFDVTKKYESYAKILEVALGSQKESKKSLDLIQETAKETVFSVDELTASYIKFANRGVKLTREEIISYADLAASQGKSFEQLTEAVLDAGTAEFERLKEFGIRASKNGDVVRLAFRGINKEVKNTPEAINAAILSFGKLDGVAGSNQEQMSTLSGMVSNLGDGFENLLKIVGEKLAPFFEGFTYLLSGTVGVISELISPTKSLSEKTSELSAQFNSEINVLLKLNPENANRARLIADINSKYGDYLPSLITERTTTEELYKFQYLANQEFKKKIFYQAYQEELNKELQKTKKATQEIADIELKRVRTQQGAPRLKQVFGSVAADQIIDKGLKEEDDRAIKSNEVIIDNYDKRVAEVETVYSKLVAKLGVTLQDLEAQFGAVVAAPVIDTTTNNISGVVKEKIKTDLEKLKSTISDLETQLENQVFKKDFVGAESTKNLLDDANQKLIEFQSNLKKYDKEDRNISIAKILGLGPDDKEFLFEYFELVDKGIDGLFKKREIDKKTYDYIKLVTGSILRPEDISEDIKKDQKQGFDEQIGSALNKAKDKRFNEGDEDKPFLQGKFKMTDEEFAIFKDRLKQAENELKKVVDAVYQYEIETNQKRIDLQQTRVEKAKEFAEKGKVEQLKIEEDRLAELLRKQESYVAQQRALANAEVLASSGVAVASSIAAVANSFKTGGPAGIATGIATSLALGAQIAFIIQTVRSSFSDLNFKDGIERLKGPGTSTSDSIPAWLSKNERVVDAKTNSEIGFNFPNKKLAEAVKLYKLFPTIAPNRIMPVQVQPLYVKKLENRLSEIEDSISHLSFNVSLDAEGFAAKLDKKKNNLIVRKNMIG